MSQRLKDTDPMPFGEYKDKRMQDVPAAYLDYIRDQPWINRWPKVKEYIDYNRAVIDKELEDPKSFGGSGNAG